MPKSSAGLSGQSVPVPRRKGIDAFNCREPIALVIGDGVGTVRVVAGCQNDALAGSVFGWSTIDDSPHADDTSTFQQ